MSRTRPVIDRFEEKVQLCPMSGCWLWTASVNHKGYGIFMGELKQTNDLAHRVSYRMFVGPIPDGLCVLHRCDVPPCANPAHLFLGTKYDNAQDMIAKGRDVHVGPKGKMCHLSKLTDADVLSIRRRYAEGGVSQSELAREYGIAQTNISGAIRGKTWKHV